MGLGGVFLAYTDFKDESICSRLDMAAAVDVIRSEHRHRLIPHSPAAFRGARIPKNSYNQLLPP